MIVLTPEKHALINKLRPETKFLPHDLPQHDYTGPETDEDTAPASTAL